MDAVHVLIIENKPNWQGLLAVLLKRLGSDAAIDVAPSRASALRLIADTNYDLVTVDLSLSDDNSQSIGTDLLPGMEMLADLRASQRNHDCAIVVLTAYPTTGRAVKAVQEHGAFGFIDKSEFEIGSFLDLSRSAILDARFRQSKARADASYHVTVSFNEHDLIGSELRGPGLRDLYVADPPLRVDLDSLSTRADGIDLLVRRREKNPWRTEARLIGDAVYGVLVSAPRVLAHLTSAQSRARSSGQVLLQFRGPAAGLGVPFELLRSSGGPLCLSHNLSRSLVWPTNNVLHKTFRFSDFMANLCACRDPLRVLIVGANSDGAIPSAESEARVIAGSIGTCLVQLGIEHKIDLFVGADATYCRTREALDHGRYHLFHYAGHGWHEQASPELSGLVLQDSDGLRTLTAADLNQLVSDTPLQLVYLSCCLSARNGSHMGRGDFHGVLEAIARGDVPYVIGYRWMVADRPAEFMAAEFYHSLWRTFSPAESLRHARIQASMGLEGRDDETWASPVLVDQNS